MSARKDKGPFSGLFSPQSGGRVGFTARLGAKRPCLSAYRDIIWRAAFLLAGAGEIFLRKLLLSKKSRFKALLPLLAFLVPFIRPGVGLPLSGAEMPFYRVPDTAVIIPSIALALAGGGNRQEDVGEGIGAGKRAAEAAPSPHRARRGWSARSPCLPGAGKSNVAPRACLPLRPQGGPPHVQGGS